MKSGKTHILVEVESLYNNEVETSVLKEDGSKFKLQFDPSFEPYKYVKISANVIAVPEEYVSEPLTYKHHEFPKGKKELPEFYTARDFPNPDIRVGDKVYFHYLSLRPTKEEQFSVSYVTQIDSRKSAHLIDNKNLYCYVRDGQITMLFGTCLVKQLFDEDVEDVEIKGHNVKCKVTKSGLVTSVGEHPLLQEGILEHINPSDFPLSRRELKKGDRVVFVKNAKFENEIEGEKYYLMKEWDILAVKKGDEYIPLNDYLCIKEHNPKPKSALVDIDKFIKPNTNKIGIITDIGENCDDFKVGDMVMYNSRTPFHIEFNGKTYLRKQEIFAYYYEGEN